METVDPRLVVKHAFQLINLYPDEVMELNISTAENNYEIKKVAGGPGNANVYSIKQYRGRVPTLLIYHINGLFKILYGQIITVIELHNELEQEENWTIVLYKCDTDTCFDVMHNEQRIQQHRGEAASRIQGRFRTNQLHKKRRIINTEMLYAPPLVKGHPGGQEYLAAKEHFERNQFGANKLVLVSIKKSNKPGKKMMATFKKNGRIKVVHFGSTGYQDYTIHHDLKRKKNYTRRHLKDLKTKDPSRAGFLSMYVLWNKKSLPASISDYRRRLNKFNKTGKF